jgi:hypothetical protein
MAERPPDAGHKGDRDQTHKGGDGHQRHGIDAGAIQRHPRASARTRRDGVQTMLDDPARRNAIEDVILTANPHYYPRMSDRIRALGARPVPFLAAFGMLAGSSESL